MDPPCDLLEGLKPGLLTRWDHYGYFAIQPHLGLAKATNHGQVNNVGRMVKTPTLAPTAPQPPRVATDRSVRHLIPYNSGLFRSSRRMPGFWRVLRRSIG